MRASSEYDQITGARAAAPIGQQIAFGLLTSFLPEIKILGRMAKRYASSPASASWRAIARTATKSSATSWEKLADDVMNKTLLRKQLDLKVEKFAEAIDAASKHAIDAVQHPLEANHKLDEESSKRLAAWTSKNQILSRIIRDINRTLAGVALFEPILFRFILWYDGADLVNWIKQKFADADLDSPVTNNPADFDVLGDVILYDMLRLYTKTYFVVQGRKGTSVDSLRSSYDEGLIEGLDAAQREAIYNRFRRVPWMDPTRPPIDGYRDLIKYWGGRYELTLGSKREEREIGHYI